MGESLHSSVELWLKSHEAISHAVFVLATHEVPVAFAADAEKLGSASRALMAICHQWRWGFPSGMASKLQQMRDFSAPLNCII